MTSSPSASPVALADGNERDGAGVSRLVLPAPFDALGFIVEWRIDVADNDVIEPATGKRSAVDDVIHFNLSVKAPLTRWLGIGLTSNAPEAPMMRGADIYQVTLGTSGDSLALYDRYGESNALPLADNNNDLFNGTFLSLNGRTSILFSRPLLTSDPDNQDIQIKKGEKGKAFSFFLIFSIFSKKLKKKK